MIVQTVLVVVLGGLAGSLVGGCIGLGAIAWCHRAAGKAGAK
jgi:hypothetical protein